MTTLITGTPVGNLQTMDEIYVEGAPYIFIQETSANPLKNPDANGFYWGLSGTTAYPVYELGCLTDVAFTEGLTMGQIRCDQDGDRGVVQRRDYIEITFTLSNIFDLATLRHIMNLSAVTSGSGLETVGIGAMNNSRYYMVYCPKVYDPDTGDYVMFHFHRAQFVDAPTINMKGGEPWTITGLKLRAFADTTKATAQKFGVIMRADPSGI
jgi:hypothetical protein